jgi:hypothetical protein
MRDAPVFDGGCEPLISRQDASPRYRIAVSPATAPYCASGLVLGSFSDLGARSGEVRFTSMNGHRQADPARPKTFTKSDIDSITLRPLRWQGS